MPTYEYECPEGHHFEVFQKMSDDPVSTCPECGAPATRKISGGAGFLFKGEGFYITDYRSDEYQKKASAEKGEGGTSKPASTTSSEKSSKESTGSTSKPSGGASGASGSSSSGSDD